MSPFYIRTDVNGTPAPNERQAATLVFENTLITSRSTFHWTEFIHVAFKLEAKTFACGSVIAYMNSFSLAAVEETGFCIRQAMRTFALSWFC